MTIKGDMAGFASSKTGVDYDTCRKVVEAALSIGTDWDFSQRFLNEEARPPNAGNIYIDAVKFLQRMV